MLGHGVALRPLAAGAGAAGPARLVFGLAPYLSDEAGNAGYHLVPDGPFAVESPVESPVGTSVGAGGAGPRVICGVSGLEYLGLPAEGGALAFRPGQPAYAPLGPARTGADSLTSHGTTSWVSVAADADTVTYYSQPEDAPLYTAGSPAAAGGVDLLEFCEVPAAAPAGTAFPMAPFHGLVDGAIDRAVAVERLAVAPTRRAVLLPGEGGAPAEGADSTVAVTPQGLAVGLAPDLGWNWLGIGHDGDAAAEPDLRFTAVTGPFRQAMQTNNLFLVLGDPQEFNRFGSVAYELTTAALDVIATIPEEHGGVPAEVLRAVRGAMHDTGYDTRTAFLAALVEAVPGITEAEQRVFLRYGGRLTPVAGGWPFRLSPDSWRESTHLIVKFVPGRSIVDLVEDVSTWAWPAAASRTGRPADAQAAIRGVIDAARSAPAGSPYASFLQVVRDPDWTGVLALSAEVPLEQLPAELQVLAAGIDPERFTAHHLGIPLTPFRRVGGRLTFERSAMFGLIDYQNPEDQYFSENIHFAFRVLQLTVGVRNSVVTAFSSRVELLVNRLFGAPARLLPTTRGNNIVLDGALQRQQLPDGTAHDTFVFAMAGQNTFRLDGPVLRSVELLSTQLVTERAADPASGRANVDAVFQLAGNLRFHEPERFDPFCYGPDAAGADGYLRFGGLAVAMSFDLGDPAGTTRFTLRDGNLSLDAANSRARAQSLAARFPIRPNGLIATPDPALATGAPPPPQTPTDLGYVSVTAPLEQAVLAQPWYGLDYTVDLGSLGALAGSKALALQVLVAWSPATGDTGPGIYLGVRLPGANGSVGAGLPLQGVVTMGFRSVEFLVGEEPELPRTYTLRLRDFALRLLGLALPPGHNDVILFGNPDQGGASKVGWYLAYASAADPKRLPPRRSGRRCAPRGGVTVQKAQEGKQNPLTVVKLLWCGQGMTALVEIYNDGVEKEEADFLGLVDCGGDREYAQGALDYIARKVGARYRKLLDLVVVTQQDASHVGLFEDLGRLLQPLRAKLWTVFVAGGKGPSRSPSGVPHPPAVRPAPGRVRLPDAEQLPPGHAGRARLDLRAQRHLLPHPGVEPGDPVLHGARGVQRPGGGQRQARRRPAGRHGDRHDQRDQPHPEPGGAPAAGPGLRTPAPRRARDRGQEPRRGRERTGRPVGGHREVHEGRQPAERRGQRRPVQPLQAPGPGGHRPVRDPGARRSPLVRLLRPARTGCRERGWRTRRTEVGVRTTVEAFGDVVVPGTDPEAVHDGTRFWYGDIVYRFRLRLGPEPEPAATVEFVPRGTSGTPGAGEAVVRAPEP
ncbi:hypothetical protein ACFQ0M_40305 [Kitasatospora aburaviensis]